MLGVVVQFQQNCGECCGRGAGGWVKGLKCLCLLFGWFDPQREQGG